MMEKFEAYINPQDEVEIFFPDSSRTIQLESPEGLTFAVELVKMLRDRYPSMLLAVEARFSAYNSSLAAMMGNSAALYAQNVIHTVCSCCFGERDHVFDYDGKRFRMERPSGCRLAKFCPWNGYAERNRDSFMVICGAKREFGFTPQERRVALLIRQGYTDVDVIASAMSLAPKTVRNTLCNIYVKCGCDSLPDLINLLHDENI